MTLCRVASWISAQGAPMGVDLGDWGADVPETTDKIRSAPSAGPRYKRPGASPAVDGNAEALAGQIDDLYDQVLNHQITNFSFFLELLRLNVIGVDAQGRTWRRWVWSPVEAALVRLERPERADIVHTSRGTYCLEWKWSGGEKIRCEVHRLIYHCFVAPITHPRMLIRHANGNQGDNRPENLYAPRDKRKPE